MPEPITSADAQRKIDAIDKRIDAVRADMYRAAGVDFDAFDVMTKDGEKAARTAAHETRRAFPAHVGFEDSLSRRRWHWMDVRDIAARKEAKAAERRERDRIRKLVPTVCPTCGSHTLQVA